MRNNLARYNCVWSLKYQLLSLNLLPKKLYCNQGLPSNKIINKKKHFSLKLVCSNTIEESLIELAINVN